MEIKIEKNVPLVAKQGALTGTTRVIYPFNQMKPGDSFQIEEKDVKLLKRRRQSLHCCAISFAKKENKPWKFSTRLTGKTTCRIWRIK